VANLTAFFFDNGHKVTPLPDVSDQLFLRTREEGNDKLIRFAVLLVLSTAIATGGILVDSTATVIGAMIVAPLATPIQAIGLAIVTTRPAQIARSAGILIASIAVVVALPWIFTALLHIPVNLETNPQIIGRVSPGLLDLFVAIATGLVGAYATARSDLSGVLPGVAIAISLVPPLAVVGICLSQGGWDQAWGAFLLFAANAVAMIICAMIVFGIAGYGAAARHDRRAVRRPVLIVMAALTFLVITLAVTSTQSVIGIVETQRATRAAEAWLAGSTYDLVAVSTANGIITIEVVGTGDLPPSPGFTNVFEPVLWSEPVIRLRVLTGSDQIITG
jgi:uncharacterized hydrophobic protein (TIGR00271 family)